MVSYTWDPSAEETAPHHPSQLPSPFRPLRAPFPVCRDLRSSPAFSGILCCLSHCGWLVSFQLRLPSSVHVAVYDGISSFMVIYYPIVCVIVYIYTLLWVFFHFINDRNGWFRSNIEFLFIGMANQVEVEFWRPQLGCRPVSCQPGPGTCCLVDALIFSCHISLIDFSHKAATVSLKIEVTQAGFPAVV